MRRAASYNIDQMFSTFLMFLDRHSVEFISDIRQAVDNAYKKEKTNKKVMLEEECDRLHDHLTLVEDKLQRA